ncbi:MAG TPA: XdhC family protein [Gemmatimonadaceae bacterium]|nr:XdhC family protein [Gemmatimonadaceae bacterium]
MSASGDAELFEQLDALRGRERRAAMATLIATRGTTPRKEGAKMWVGEGGRIVGSVTIGGCVDAQVVLASEEALASGTCALLSIPMTDEDAWDMGLTCGGVVDVLVEPVELARADDPVLRAYDLARAEVSAGRHAVVATRLPNAALRLVILEDGSTHGSLGHAALDDAAREQALATVRSGRSRVVELPSAEGETMRVFLELHAPVSTLVIFGAGQVAIPLAELARTLGWRVVLADARERYATRERFPQVDEIRIGMLGEIARELAYNASTFVVIVAHDYKFEIPVLRAVLERDPAYIGLLGNRRRGRAVLDQLARDGVSADALARVHVPVGLDIGAQTAPEIALSILAEAVSVRAHRPGTPLRDGGG